MKERVSTGKSTERFSTELPLAKSDAWLAGPVHVHVHVHVMSCDVSKSPRMTGRDTVRVRDENEQKTQW